MAYIDQILRALKHGPITAKNLAASLGVSQPTISRALRDAGKSVLQIGHARASRYARTVPIFGNALSIPIYRISESGIPDRVAVLYRLAGGGYYIGGDEIPAWMEGESGIGLFDGLPYYLDDLRPQGFLGNRLAKQLASTGLYPESLRNWREEHVGTFLLREGHDLPGDLVVGDYSLSRTSVPPVAVDNKTVSYPQLAAQVISGNVGGSSAGGERPKFIAYTRDRGHVIVKFSSPVDSPESIRWRDLLIAEHHAGQTIKGAGLSAAESEIYEFADRVFLEVKRFDRIGEFGRAPVISLTMIDAEYVGAGRDWPTSIEALYKQRSVSDSTVQSVIWLHVFGQWIGNTDMHLGNLSFRPDGDQFDLLPNYDMQPMAFVPHYGELIDRQLGIPVRRPGYADIWTESGHAAVQFWHRVAEDNRISDGFQRIAERQVEWAKGLLK